MILKCEEKQWEERIFDYIGKEYYKCLYVYIDLRKYACEEKSLVNAWIDLSSKQEIKAVILQYHTGVHIYSKNNDFNKDEVCRLIKEINPDVICGIKENIDLISKEFEDFYRLEYGHVGKVEHVLIERDPRVIKAEEKHIPEIAKLISEDEGFGVTFGFDEIKLEIMERLKHKFSRNYIMVENDEIVSIIETSAELSDIAVTGGLVTPPKYRGNGYGTIILASICQDLLDEGKKVYSFYYTKNAHRVHEKVGYKLCCDYAKLSKKK